MAEKSKEKSRGIKGLFGHTRQNKRDDVNIKPHDVTEERHKQPGDQKHDTPRGMGRNPFSIFRKNKSHKEKDDRQNIPAGTDRSTATAGDMVKDPNTEVNPSVPTGTVSHTDTFTKISSVSIKPGLLNQNQEKSAFTESSLSMDTLSDISPTHIVSEDLQPGLQEKGAGRYDISAHTSVDDITGVGSTVSTDADTQLSRDIELYQDRILEAIEESVAALSANLLHKDVLIRVEYEQIGRLMGKNSRTKAAKLLLDMVLERGDQARRIMWDTFQQMQNSNEKLKEILQAIERKGLVIDDDLDIRPILQIFSNNDLRKVTNFYRQRLEDAIEDHVQSVANELLAAKILDDSEHAKIRQRVESNVSSEASKMIFEVVFGKGINEGRTMWDTFGTLQNKIPKLKKILKEIKEKGSNLAGDASWSDVGSTVPEFLQEIHKLNKEWVKVTVNNCEKEEMFSLDKYTDLQIISSPRQRSLVEHELLSRGNEHEKWQKLNVKQLLEKVQIDQLFRSSFSRTSLSGTSVVTGVAGIGKTTMVRKIVHNWATGKIYQQFNFLFLFKFRDLNTIKNRTSLNQMVLDSYPYFQKYLQNVWKEPNNILIIFDGLDEFNEKIDFSDQQRNAATEYHCFDPECRCEVSDIVRCLVQGKVLKGCSVLITSRPTDLESLDQAEVSLWAEILGFFKEERREYFKRFYQNEDLAAEVFAYVEQNDILYTLCFNPCYCGILCSTLEPLFNQLKANEISLPETVSDLFSNYIDGLLKRWGCDRENRRELLLKIGAMAYEGVCKRKVIFYDKDFIRHGLQPSHFTSGFMMEILEEDTSTNAVVHTFPHLTTQEFIAALSVLLNPPPQGIRHILNNAYSYSDGRFEIFLRFLIGLSSPSSALKLQGVLGSFPESSTKQVKDWLKAQLEEDFKNVHSEENKRKLLNTFYLLHESQDTQLMRQILGSMKKSEFSGVTLNRMDCRILATVLRPCETIEELNIVYCGIESEHIQRLLPVLRKCKKLSLNRNNLKDAGVHALCEMLSRADCKIEILELENNGLTDACIEELCSTLSKNQSLTIVELSSNEKHGDRRNCFTYISCLQLENLAKQRKKQIQIRLTSGENPREI